MNITSTAGNTYTAADPGLGESPHYLVSERNKHGECVELYWETGHVPKQDDNGVTLSHGAWKVTVYDRTDEAIDSHWFRNFRTADAAAVRLLEVA